MTPLLEVRDLHVSFAAHGGRIAALNGVSLHVDPGETLAILGESGSGKSVTAAAVMGLIEQPPGRIDRGEVLLAGVDLLRLAPTEHRRRCGEVVSLVFQNALAALNPVYPVGWQIAEVFRIHGRVRGAAAAAAAVKLMERVGIPAAAERAHLYPHQFSGGMRQRAMIAMAIALGPDLVIADEPTTALDVTVQAQIVELLREVRRESGSALLLITHDFGLVAELADRVVVMYAGRVVEQGDVFSIFADPQHPYTRGLLACQPRLDDPVGDLHPIPGMPPDPAHLPNGCPFRPRCAVARPICARFVPPLLPIGTGLVACHVAAGTA